MKYSFVLLVMIFVNIFFMLFSMDNYVKSIAAGTNDVTSIVLGSLFLILLFFICAFMFSRTAKYSVF